MRKRFHIEGLVCRGRRAGWSVCMLALAVWLAAAGAQAMSLMLDLAWGNDSTADTDLSVYNLQEGSLIQVIAYNSATATAPDPSRPDLNFEYYGGHTGEGVPAAPYTTGDAHIPTTEDVYLANTTPEGHTMVYETYVQEADRPNDQGYRWYRVVEEFELLDTYDTVYIRVFGATDIQQGVVTASYWGISSTNHLDPQFVTAELVLDDVSAPNKNYFEVIPEPGTLALLGLGGAALLGWRRRRNRWGGRADADGGSPLG